MFMIGRLILLVTMTKQNSWERLCEWETTAMVMMQKQNAQRLLDKSYIYIYIYIYIYTK